MYSMALPHCVCQEFDRSRGEEAVDAAQLNSLIIKRINGLTFVNPELGFTCFWSRALICFTFFARSTFRPKQSTLFVSFYRRPGSTGVVVSFSQRSGLRFGG